MVVLYGFLRTTSKMSTASLDCLFYPGIPWFHRYGCLISPNGLPLGLGDGKEALFEAFSGSNNVYVKIIRMVGETYTIRTQFTTLGCDDEHRYDNAMIGWNGAVTTPRLISPSLPVNSPQSQ